MGRERRDGCRCPGVKRRHASSRTDAGSRYDVDRYRAGSRCHPRSHVCGEKPRLESSRRSVDSQRRAGSLCLVESRGRVGSRLDIVWKIGLEVVAWSRRRLATPRLASPGHAAATTDEWGVRVGSTSSPASWTRAVIRPWGMLPWHLQLARARGTWSSSRSHQWTVRSGKLGSGNSGWSKTLGRWSTWHTLHGGPIPEVLSTSSRTVKPPTATP